MIEKVKEIVLNASKFMFEKVDKIDEKDGVTNIVTAQDLEVQEFLVKELKKLIKDSSFFCEEEGLKDLSKDYVWIIDPIDGTTNFSRGIPFTVISVALAYKNEVILGVVYNPFSKEMFCAEKGKGSYLNGNKIHVSNRSFNECLLATAFSCYDKTKSIKCINFLRDIFNKVNDIRRIGSAANELCYLACGRIDLFYEIRLRPWDYAASSIIIREAGGTISTENIDDIVLNRDVPVYAGNSQLNHKKLFEAVQDSFNY